MFDISIDTMTMWTGKGTKTETRLIKIKNAMQQKIKKSDIVIVTDLF